MTSLIQTLVSCPYCAEYIEVLIDPHDVGQQYIEDCQVCCQPILFNVVLETEGSLSVSVHGENEIY
ncbi:CPXCG motif-containing cysteine-rich protein [Denitrificimonas sp. JX-1]|uniref:CPXCG motif-containing cysteine-rich protein n=1 Tax=Denitrificimonas halotolerans TaxID=3098930 RepID=A0ABU5GMR6_9GAMM|nr:CPXCG motif-containing cysteine-rich protein [Denitrificimonas sp. JX-1]MDY7218242.1 CPXCG motif-containing cysteine-rich protein [Denitrificimonas sp. JX-1]